MSLSSSFFCTAICKFCTRTRTTNSPYTKTKASWLKKIECQMNLTWMEGMGWPPKTILQCVQTFGLNQGNVFGISLNVTETFAPLHLYSFPLNIRNIWMNLISAPSISLFSFFFWIFFYGSHIVAEHCFVCALPKSWYHRICRLTAELVLCHKC